MIEIKSLWSEYEEKARPMVSYGDGNVGKTLGYEKQGGGRKKSVTPLTNIKESIGGKKRKTTACVKLEEKAESIAASHVQKKRRLVKATEKDRDKQQKAGLEVLAQVALGQETANPDKSPSNPDSAQSNPDEANRKAADTTLYVRKQSKKQFPQKGYSPQEPSSQCEDATVNALATQEPPSQSVGASTKTQQTILDIAQGSHISVDADIQKTGSTQEPSVQSIEETSEPQVPQEPTVQSTVADFISHPDMRLIPDKQQNPNTRSIPDETVPDSTNPNVLVTSKDNTGAILVQPLKAIPMASNTQCTILSTSTLSASMIINRPITMDTSIYMTTDHSSLPHLISSFPSELSLSNEIVRKDQEKNIIIERQSPVLEKGEVDKSDKREKNITIESDICVRSDEITLKEQRDLGFGSLISGTSQTFSDDDDEFGDSDDDDNPDDAAMEARIEASKLEEEGRERRRGRSKIT
ncbi:hypothetical protein AgCh_018600 [Apium graveolens]